MDEEGRAMLGQFDTYCAANPKEAVMGVATMLVIREYDARGDVLKRTLPRTDAK
ncbi:MAG: hypothetical protein RB191_15570 [Terriglobia bacterium]|nr:hypothetical protein [Terriglobia bacterium]